MSFFGKDGLILAVVEVNRTERNPMDWQTQARFYTDVLEAKAAIP